MARAYDDELAVRGIDAAPGTRCCKPGRSASRNGGTGASRRVCARTRSRSSWRADFDHEIRDLVDGAWILDDGLEDSTTRRRQAAARTQHRCHRALCCRGCRKPMKRERDHMAPPTRMRRRARAALPAIDALFGSSRQLLAGEDATRDSVEAAAAEAALYPVARSRSDGVSAGSRWRASRCQPSGHGCGGFRWIRFCVVAAALPAATGLETGRHSPSAVRCCLA